MKRISFIFLLLIVFGLSAFSQADKIVGIWLTAEGESQIRIFKATNGKYYGKIEWLKEDKDKKDTNNPVEAERDKTILGLTILKGFSFNEKDNKWDSGTIYDPDNGKTYDCFMWFENDPSTLKIKGYILGMKFVGRETSWKKEDKIREL